MARHLVACALASEEDDEARAVEHAKWAARFGARVPAVRELYGALLYQAGDYKPAVRELRAAMRMSGRVDLLPMIADCERGLGRPEKALDVAQMPEASKLSNVETIELMIVVAGAYADMGDLDTALATLEVPALRHKVDGSWQVRLWLAYADVLEAQGHAEEARKWVTLAADADIDEETDAGERLGREPREREDPSLMTDEQIGVVDVYAEYMREAAEEAMAEEAAANAADHGDESESASEPELSAGADLDDDADEAQTPEAADETREQAPEQAPEETVTEDDEESHDDRS
ncbi:MAG: hypothetical protein Q4G21_05360 [Dermabacter sp.]|nr:hypothetical protein [Dermabacter sp.]